LIARYRTLRRDTLCRLSPWRDQHGGTPDDDLEARWDAWEADSEELLARDDLAVSAQLAELEELLGDDRVSG
jgi:hypothetical protein